MADEQDPTTTPYHVKVGSGAYRIDRGSGDEQDRRVDAAAQALKAEFRRLNPAWFVDDARNDGPCDMTPWNLLAEAAIRAEAGPAKWSPGKVFEDADPGAAHEPDPLEARVIALEARVAAIEAGKAWGGRNRFLEYFDGSVDP